jgi:hypothetical protein
VCVGHHHAPFPECFNGIIFGPCPSVFCLKTVAFRSGVCLFLESVRVCTRRLAVAAKVRLPREHDLSSCASLHEITREEVAVDVQDPGTMGNHPAAALSAPEPSAVLSRQITRRKCNGHRRILIWPQSGDPYWGLLQTCSPPRLVCLEESSRGGVLYESGTT